MDDRRYIRLLSRHHLREIEPACSLPAAFTGQIVPNLGLGPHRLCLRILAGIHPDNHFSMSSSCRRLEYEHNRCGVLFASDRDAGVEHCKYRGGRSPLYSATPSHTASTDEDRAEGIPDTSFRNRRIVSLNKKPNPEIITKITTTICLLI